ncbi:hypothetical protein, partial [Aliarcobacter butzleri]|uniref:hypothetical protein n=1 Tax=Aliarcobacter butzleri TaxID=28197 RepID=UPI003AF7EC88
KTKIVTKGNCCLGIFISVYVLGLTDHIIEILEMRYSEQKLLEEIKQKYNNLNYLKFNTHRHAQINDENEHEEVLERWLLRLFKKIYI